MGASYVIINHQLSIASSVGGERQMPHGVNMPQKYIPQSIPPFIPPQSGIDATRWRSGPKIWTTPPGECLRMKGEKDGVVG